MATTSKKMMITDVFVNGASGLEHCYTLHDS